MGIVQNILKKIFKMPIKIKIFLTIYIISISIAVVIFENFFGQYRLIYVLFFLTAMMISGIWIFPEVVTKKTTSNDKG